MNDPLDRSRFPIDPWALTETAPDFSSLGLSETLFSVGNGYLGMRANNEEGRPNFENGTFINGFHERWRIHHAEEAYGFAKTGQTIINVPDAKVIKLYVDDEPFVLTSADLEEYSRTLSFSDGVLRRRLIWRTPAGKRIRIDSTRMVSFTDRHLAIMTFEVELLDGTAPVIISSQLINREDGHDDNPIPAPTDASFDPRRSSGFDHRVLLPQGDWHDDGRMIQGYKVANSGMTVAVAADHLIETDNVYSSEITTEPDVAKQVYRIDAEAGVPIRITKAVAYHSSRSLPVRELFDRCRRTLDRVREKGAVYYTNLQKEWLDEFWVGADVQIPGRDDLQQAIRWCIFQLAQAAGRPDGLGVAAKGVSGSGYEGHYFWDTDVYVVPFLAYSNPWIARNVLRFRYMMLPKARERATEMTLRGALFPWRTITGDEASAYYAAGTAQFHIDADVAFSFSKYAEVTGDTAFLYREGAEVLAETARMWADLGFWRVAKTGKSFHIHSVTGPDEYTTVVNNNLFTNVMARANLRHAAECLRNMKHEEPEAFERLVHKIDLREDEILEWEACADGMLIPWDETLQVHPQDEHFLERELWDLPNAPKEKRPLLLHYHPLVIYRYQVLKQADVVLALFLQGDQFTPAEKRRNFDYYDPITTGDSTLSAVVQSIIAAEVGYDDLALSYFYEALFVDLADYHNNTSDGVHIASAGGVWNSLVYGFGGMRDFDGKITFDPRLPSQWPELKIPLRIRGSFLQVSITARRMTFEVTEGPGLEVWVRKKKVKVPAAGDGNVVVPLLGQGPALVEEPIFAAVGEERSDGTLITADVPSLDTPADESGLIGFGESEIVL